MDCKQQECLNRFFVQTFNKIMAAEERALQASGVTNLSVRELHIVEAAVLCGAGEATMSRLAAMLGISVGALTTAVNTLVRKGYLVRRGRPDDRRIVLVEPTEAGLTANEQHERFHEQMIEAVAQQLPQEQLTTLTASLEALSEFFENFNKTGETTCP
ncbi:MAG: MarR family transcriptional regulator [Clostridia bacterium]|nr:MarR family transcriptional regulator [Clostridia bacterium]